jgi:hypothetical protein
MDNFENILYLGLRFAGYVDLHVSAFNKRSKFRSLYGLEPETVRDIFLALLSDVVGESRLSGNNIKSLFLTIYWLKSYDIEASITRVFGIGSPATSRAHIRRCLVALQTLCQVEVSI